MLALNSEPITVVPPFRGHRLSRDLCFFFFLRFKFEAMITKHLILSAKITGKALVISEQASGNRHPLGA